MTHTNTLRASSGCETNRYKGDISLSIFVCVCVDVCVCVYVCARARVCVCVYSEQLGERRCKYIDVFLCMFSIIGCKQLCV